MTIAVVAERGPLKYSKAPVGIGKGDAEGLPEDDIKTLSLDAPVKPALPYNNRWKSKTKEESSSKPSGKRYVNLRLIDFGCRTKTSTTGDKATIRGDAFLSLLLFESNEVEEITREDGSKQKLYKGGSRGSFERMAKLKEGSVIALLNPKILRPFQVCSITSARLNTMTQFGLPPASQRHTTSDRQHPRANTRIHRLRRCHRPIARPRHVQRHEARWQGLRRLVRQTRQRRL